MPDYGRIAALELEAWLQPNPAGRVAALALEVWFVPSSPRGGVVGAKQLAGAGQLAGGAGHLSAEWTPPASIVEPG